MISNNSSKKKKMTTMKGRLSHELEIGAPADVAWEAYGTLQLSKLVVKLLPNIFQEIKVQGGDGGVGTVLDITFNPGKSSHLISSVVIERLLKRTSDMKIIELILD